jgi:hypothetical protein
MVRLTDDQVRLLAHDFAERLGRDAPDWTDRPDDDPGVTLLQVLAFLSETLVYRAHSIPERGDRAAARTIEQLDTLRRLASATPIGLTRVRYFTGQLLTASDFQAEQDYFRSKQRRHNLLLSGSGVARGLRVSVDATSDDSAPIVTIEPGCAIAPDGEELCVPDPLVCTLAASASSRFVTLKYVERPVGLPSGNGEPTACEPSRIEEGIRVDFVDEIPAGAIAIARLEHDGTVWRATAPDGG